MCELYYNQYLAKSLHGWCHELHKPVSGTLLLPMSAVSVIPACTNITLSFSLNVFLLLLMGCVWDEEMNYSKHISTAAKKTIIYLTLQVT